MVANAKQIIGYEHTADSLEPMNEERYRAFLQVGLDELARGEGIDDADLDSFFEELLAKIASGKG